MNFREALSSEVRFCRQTALLVLGRERNAQTRHRLLANITSCVWVTQK